MSFNKLPAYKEVDNTPVYIQEAPPYILRVEHNSNRVVQRSRISISMFARKWLFKLKTILSLFIY